MSVKSSQYLDDFLLPVKRFTVGETKDDCMAKRVTFLNRKLYFHEKKFRLTLDDSDKLMEISAETKQLNNEDWFND